jgi:hypothetical protein
MSVWGNSPWLSPLETLKIIPSGLLWVSMALILIGKEGFFGISWLVCSIDGTCLCVLGLILMLPASSTKGREELIYALLWYSFLTSFFIKARWTFLLSAKLLLGQIIKTLLLGQD